MGIFSKYRANQILSSMRPKDTSADYDVTSEVILAMFTDAVDPNTIECFIAKIPKKFVTSAGTTILDEYIKAEYYKKDKNYEILTMIVKHDPSYLLKPHKIVGNHMIFITDLDLPVEVLKAIEEAPNKKSKPIGVDQFAPMQNCSYIPDLDNTYSLAGSNCPDCPDCSGSSNYINNVGSEYVKQYMRTPDEKLEDYLTNTMKTRG